MEISEEQRLVNRLKEKSHVLVGDFLRSKPGGTLEESIEWLKGMVNRVGDKDTREIVDIILKADVGPESGVISVPFPGTSSQPGVWSAASVPKYPSAIWQQALNEARQHKA